QDGARGPRLAGPSRGNAGAAGAAVRPGPRGGAGARRPAGGRGRRRSRYRQLAAWPGHRSPGRGPGGGSHRSRRPGRGLSRHRPRLPAGGAVASRVAGGLQSLLPGDLPRLRRGLPGLGRAPCHPVRPRQHPDNRMSTRKRTRAASSAEQQESTLRRWLKDRRITEVECLVPDITGNARGKIIPADKFSHDYGTRLPEGIFATTVTGDYPDDYYELTSPSDSDMMLRPDPDTVRMVPWATDPTAQVIHDCYTKDGHPHELAPRNVLRKVLAEYEKEGLQPVVAPELEFFLVQKNTDPDFPLLPPAGRSGRPETARQSYSIDAVNEFDPILDLMYDYCDAMELDVDTLIHESGAAQLEVNFTHAGALSLADQVFLFKRTMRE